MSIVLDTDVWSFLFKDDSRAEAYRAHLEGHVLYISFQTVAELYQWVEMADWGERRRERLYRWMRRFEILGYDEQTARIWAQIRNVRSKAGRPLSAQDAWVAACAIRHSLALVTHNADDYELISGLRVISEAP